MSSPWSLIILDQPDPLEREAVHEIVKAYADEWWHELENVWIASGHSPEFWRDVTRPALPFGASGVVVIALPPESRDDFRAWGPGYANRTAWVGTLFDK